MSDKKKSTANTRYPQYTGERSSVNEVYYAPQPAPIKRKKQRRREDLMPAQNKWLLIISVLILGVGLVFPELLALLGDRMATVLRVFAVVGIVMAILATRFDNTVTGFIANLFAKLIKRDDRYEEYEDDSSEGLYGGARASDFYSGPEMPGGYRFPIDADYECDDDGRIHVTRNPAEDVEPVPAQCICKSCGKPQESADAVFCKYCGKKLVEEPKTITCPKCKKVMAPDSAFCDKCGTKLAPAPAPTPANNSDGDGRKPKTGGKK